MAAGSADSLGAIDYEATANHAICSQSAANFRFANAKFMVAAE